MNRASKPSAGPKTILVTCFSIQAIGIGIYIAYGVFFNPLMAEYGWPRALISGASSIAFFTSGLAGILIGRLNDRIGPKTIMLVTAVFFGAGYALLSVLGTALELYLYFGVIFGIGLGSIDVIALTTIARWFPDRRGMMTGITKVGTGAGQFLFPLLAAVLIRVWGWRMAAVILGAVSCVLLMLIARVIRRDAGGPGGALCEGEGKTDCSGLGLPFAQARKTPQFWMICFINTIIVACMLSVLVHIVPHARDTGIPAARAASVLAVIGAVSMAGRFITGMVVDKVGSQRSMVLSLVVLIAAFVWLQRADSLGKLYLFAAVYGFAHGSFFTVISPMVAEFFGTAFHGALFGVVAFFGTAGGALGPFMTGRLFDLNGSYAVPFSLFLAVAALGLGILLMLRPVKLAGPSPEKA